MQTLPSSYNRYAPLSKMSKFMPVYASMTVINDLTGHCLDSESRVKERINNHSINTFYKSKRRQDFSYLQHQQSQKPCLCVALDH